MPANNPLLSIILPAFNEGAHIFANIGKVRDEKWLTRNPINYA